MKTKQTKTDTQKELDAMTRAASRVLSEAVRDNREIPIWDGEKVVWKVPREEAKAVGTATLGH